MSPMTDKNIFLTKLDLYLRLYFTIDLILINTFRDR